MTWHCGWRDGTPNGKCVLLPDEAAHLVTNDDAQRIRDRLKTESGKEPHTASMRSRLLKLARARRK